MTARRSLRFILSGTRRELERDLISSTRTMVSNHSEPVKAHNAGPLESKPALINSIGASRTAPLAQVRQLIRRPTKTSMALVLNFDMVSRPLGRSLYSGETRLGDLSNVAHPFGASLQDPMTGAMRHPDMPPAVTKQRGLAKARATLMMNYHLAGND